MIVERYNAPQRHLYANQAGNRRRLHIRRTHQPALAVVGVLWRAVRSATKGFL